MKLPKFGRFIITLAASIIIFGCQQHSFLSEGKKQKEELIDSESSVVHSVNQNLSDLEKITYLKKIGEIEDGFCEEEYNFFAKITSLCLDADNNLYVADSGLHRIYKFDHQGKYINSFGSQGQGPGDFLGTLRMSFGNDGRLYITDDGNFRLSIFSFRGEFIQQFPIVKFLRDVPVANSKGEIYLLSRSGLKIIDFFDSEMVLKQSLLEMNNYLNFPYYYPSKKILKLMMLRPSINEVKKLLIKEDHLIVIFDNSQMVVHFDKNHQIVNQFRIEHPRFISDYKIRLKKARSKGRWLRCFRSVFLDNKENLCFSYFNAALGLLEIFRYRKGGTFIDALRVKNIKEPSTWFINACDIRGNFYSISSNSTKIIIYQIIN